MKNKPIDLRGNWKKNEPFEIRKPRDLFNPYLIATLEEKLKAWERFFHEK